MRLRDKTLGEGSKVVEKPNPLLKIDIIDRIMKLGYER